MLVEENSIYFILPKEKTLQSKMDDVKHKTTGSRLR